MDININIDNLNKTLLEQGFTKARVSNNKELIKSVVQYVIESTEMYKQAEEEINRHTKEIEIAEKDIDTKTRQLLDEETRLYDEKQRLEILKKEINDCTSQNAKDKILMAAFFRRNVRPTVNNSEGYNTYVETLGKILS